MDRINSENVRKLNPNMTAYVDPKTGNESIRLSLNLRDKDKRNGDLMEYLLDFGNAGKLGEQILNVLEKNTEGYRRYKRNHHGGRWTHKCSEFVPEPIDYCIVTVDADNNAKLCYISQDKVDAIKEAGKIYMSLNDLDKRRLKVEIRVYDGEMGASRYDIIPWLR